MLRPLALAALAIIPSLVLACGPREWTPPSAADRNDDPDKLRPGHGNAELHTWFPVTAAEVEALKGLDAAKSGEPHALLALAVVASGDHRDGAVLADYQRRIDAFVTELRPTMDKADDYHKGYELNRAMHRVFFTGPKHGKLGAYDLNQNRVSGIFDKGNYNCISSAMLYAVLARSFSLPVRGVVVPTHAFIEYGPKDGKILEVETTSDTGFDWIHDARFFKEGAADWSSDRGLRPVTLEDYQARSIIEPWQLAGESMGDQAGRAWEAGDDRAPERNRLFELAAVVLPDDEEAAERRWTFTVDEANVLYKAKAFRTLVKMHEMLGPALASVDEKWPKSTKIMTAALWLRDYFATSLQTVGRDADAVALADAQLDRVELAGKEAETLRNNFLIIFENAMTDHSQKGEYAAGRAEIDKRLDLCLKAEVCRNNLSVLYQRWAIAFETEGDWKGSRDKLEECLKVLPRDAQCSQRLDDLESRHHF